MSWTAGNDEGQNFTGNFVATMKPVEYKGPMTETVEGRGTLVMGRVGSC